MEAPKYPGLSIIRVFLSIKSLKRVLTLLRALGCIGKTPRRHPKVCGGTLGYMAVPDPLTVSVPLATLVQTSLGLYRSPTGPGR